jgi:VWFA-related protein
MNKKKQIYRLGLILLLGSLFFIGSNSPLAAQKNKKPERKKFGWSLKAAKKEAKNNSKIDSKNFSKSNEQKNKQESMPADRNSDIDAEEAVKVDTDLILNDMLVLDNKGEAVLGLKETDFVVLEDDQPQKIEVFSAPAAEKQNFPRRFVFIIDHNNGHVGHLETSIAAAKLFVDKLAPQDTMALVTDDVKLIQDFTNDKNKLKKGLDWVYKDFVSGRGRWGGWGLTYTALHTVLNELFDEENIRPIVILQSNGQELYQLKGGKSDASQSKFGLFYGFYNFTFEDLLEKIIEKRATVYSIIAGRRFAGLSDEEKIRNLVLFQIDHQYDWTPVKLESIVPFENATDYLFIRRVLRDSIDFQTALIKVAETSGGTAKFMQTPEDAKNIYADIFADTASRYLIGYYSTNKEREQKLRNVKIAVREHPEYVVLGRKSYISR